MNKEKFIQWKKTNKLPIQVVAFILAIGAPFLLFVALNAGFSVAAGIAFGMITLAMFLVAALT